ncbi:MAG: AarF/ABC1/UbiB kinase family protein [Pseudomonadales bacterium]|nr:AarF/ABC1/UbiB kinase family protein [Pseudomonadales bacterium]
MSDLPPLPLRRVKTGALERRFTLVKAGMVAGARLAVASAGSLFAEAGTRQDVRRDALSRQAEYLVNELGKLKGSIVKIGQMMALYGEHFLSPEVTHALHKLNDSTTALAWESMETVLKDELGDRLLDLEVHHQPLGAASLGQVHRARRRSDGRELCLKIQYPGVADAVDSDLDLVTHLMRLSRLVPQTREFEEWLEEVRQMMHREVNYPLELETTRRFHDLLQADNRYIVPEVFPEYSTAHVLCTSYEPGLSINHPDVLALPQERRNTLALAALDLCAREIFLWGEIQTDPNFGNYLIHIDATSGQDRLICLDFGAVRDFPPDLIRLARGLTEAAFDKDMDLMLQAMQGYSFFDQMPVQGRERFAHLLFLAIEPFARPEDVEASCLDGQGNYLWAQSHLHKRAIAMAARTATNVGFSAPPKELMFVSRKLMGAYTFMTVIDARIQARALLQPYVDTWRQQRHQDG